MKRCWLAVCFSLSGLCMQAYRCAGTTAIHEFARVQDLNAALQSAVAKGRVPGSQACKGLIKVVHVAPIPSSTSSQHTLVAFTNTGTRILFLVSHKGRSMVVSGVVPSIVGKTTSAGPVPSSDKSNSANVVAAYFDGATTAVLAKSGSGPCKMTAAFWNPAGVWLHPSRYTCRS
jgi:Nup133 N terminal like